MWPPMPRRPLLEDFPARDDRMESTREYGGNAFKLGQVGKWILQLFVSESFGKPPEFMHLLHRSTHVI